MASNTLKQYASALKHRTIRIAPKPFPIHPFQRRAIIQILEDHGRLESFRQDRSRRGFFLATLKDQTALEGLISRSPLKIQLPKTSSPVQSSKQQTRSAIRDDPEVDSLPPNQDSSNSQRFTIYIWPEPDLDPLGPSHKNIYSQSWPNEGLSNPSFANSALRDVVPKDIRGEALAQWGFSEIDPDWPARTTMTARLRMKQWIPSKMSKRDDHGQDVDDSVLDDEDEAFLSTLRAARRNG